MHPHDNVPYLQALMVAFILDDIVFNVGRLVVSNMKFFKIHGDMHLLLSSLTIEFCKRYRVLEYHGDMRVHPGTPIYTLKIFVECAPRKSKKRKINLDMSICEETKSYRPSIIGPIKEISIDLTPIRELMLGLSQGSGEPSTTLYSYVSQCDYEKYLVDQ